MKVLIVGLGSIGRRHAGLLLEEGGHDVFVLRSQNQKGNDLGLPEVYDWVVEVEKIKPDVAFITNPTAFHIEAATKCASLGMHLFIEKALSDSMDGISALEEVCKEKNLTTYVAFNMRFNPVIQKMHEILQGKRIYHARAVCSSYLPDWRPGRDHLKNYSAIASQGGGALLDISHEFDYIEYLCGRIDTLQGKVGRLSDVTVDAEDYADVVMTLETDAVVNLHINFMSRVLERKIIVDYKGGSCIGDLVESRIIRNDSGKEETLDFDRERNTAYRAQIKYFFNNIGNPNIMNNLFEAKQLLSKILSFKEQQQGVMV